MPPEKPTTDEARKSTLTLAWLDDMIKHYAAFQHAARSIMVLMEQQKRYDVKAYNQLHEMWYLASDKLETLNTKRDEVFAKHDQLMTAYLNSED